MKQICRFIDSVGQKLIFKFPIVPKLEKDTEYVVEIREVGKDRTLEQNKYMWEVIQSISQITGQSTWVIYTTGLEKYFKENNVKGEFLMALPEAEKRLKNVYRLVIKLEDRIYNGTPMSVYKCYYGSSHFSVKEMIALTDYFTGLYFDLATN